ncbi:PAS domain-containing protein [Amylibacter sp. SFDW26]|nr:PAS domain-containing protein [Amylibacter sp. SFDW26]
MTRSGLNLIKQAISIYDRDLKLIVANRRFKDMFELPENLVQVGATFRDTIRFLAERGEYGVIDDIDAYVIEKVIQAKEFEPHYMERKRANGTTISVEGSPLRQGGWVTVYTDITEIKHQEELLQIHSDGLSEKLVSRSQQLSKINRELTASVTALEEAKRQLTESEARLNLTNAMTPAHIARVDRNGIYTYSNNKLDTVIPTRPKNIIGLTFEEAVGQEAYEQLNPKFQEALAGHSSYFELGLRDHNRYVRVAFTPDIDETGAVSGVYLLSMDVTEESKARQALMHSRRRELAAQLTSGMAHDFANLLTIILGQQNKLETQDGLSNDMQEIIATTKAAALRGGALLDGLSAIDATRNLTIKPVSFDDFMDGVSRLAYAAVADDVTVTIETNLDDAKVLLDQGFTQDALLNLVLNANEAIEGTGSIKLESNIVEDNWLEFTITDTGTGFSEEAIQNAFTPFYTSKKGRVGRGLGLSTVFDFAKVSGGHVKLDNTPQGGARVSLRIPYSVAADIKPGLVLLVEDNLEIRENIRGYLRDMNHAVIETNSAEEAQKLVQVSDITHIITDVMLEGNLTGVDLAKTISKDIPILIITSLPKTDPLRIQAENKFPVLHKPFEADDLMYFFQRKSMQC